MPGPVPAPSLRMAAGQPLPPRSPPCQRRTPRPVPAPSLPDRAFESQDGCHNCFQAGYQKRNAGCSRETFIKQNRNTLNVSHLPAFKFKRWGVICAGVAGGLEMCGSRPGGGGYRSGCFTHNTDGCVVWVRLWFFVFVLRPLWWCSVLGLISGRKCVRVGRGSGGLLCPG